jgi:hypothetical protein
VRGGIAIVALALAACGAGSGEGLDQNGQPTSAGGGSDPTVLVPTLASIQLNVFNARCTVCHSGAGAPQGLRLEPGSSAGSLIDMSSPYGVTVVRVIPGDPDNSFLVQKLEGTQAFGDRMPQDGPPFLPLATIDVIRQWIQDGAPP